MLTTLSAAAALTLCAGLWRDAGAASASAPADAASMPTPAPTPTPELQPVRVAPVYRTQIPPAATLDYEIRRGMLSGTGALSWRPDGARYEARLLISVIGFTLLDQLSQGGFDAAGLAPLRFTEQRARKTAREGRFQRAAGKVTYSGPRGEFALMAGSQDGLSWMLQLPAVLSAEPKHAQVGGEVLLTVASARGDIDLWTLRSLGTETIDTPDGALPTVKFTRAPRRAKDPVTEVWLDPARHYLPVRARITQGDADEALELVLRELRAGL